MEIGHTLLLLVYFYCDGSWLFTLCLIFCLNFMVQFSTLFTIFRPIKSTLYSVFYKKILYIICHWVWCCGPIDVFQIIWQQIQKVILNALCKTTWQIGCPPALTRHCHTIIIQHTELIVEILSILNCLEFFKDGKNH